MLVQIIGTLRGGGAERVALTLHKAFKRLGKHSKVYVLSEKVDYEVNDEDVVIGADVNDIKGDLIIAHMQDVSEKVDGNNVWHVIHNSYSFKFKKRNFFSRIKHIKEFRQIYNNRNLICVSNGVKKDVLQNLKVKPKEIKTIYNPFDFEEIREKANQKVDLGFDYIINAAALTKVKNQELLIKSYARLDTPLHLVLLGKGNQEGNLKKLVKKLGLEKKVHFLGWQSNPYKYIKNAKLFVLSSNVEGFGNVLVESLALNTPVVSTNCPSGPSEILIGELAKFLAKVNDIDDLRNKIELALNDYPEIKNEYIQKFDYIEIAKEYLELV